MDLSKEYDSYEALDVAILDLDNLNQLVSARHEAGYQRHERLKMWILLGRFMLDSCGNFMKIKDNGSEEIVPAEKYPNFPQVMSQDRLWAYIENHKETPDEYIDICSSPSWLPSSTQICPVCNKGWTIDNCHDFIDSHNNQVIDLAPYVDKTIAFFKSNWNQSPKVLWRIQPEKALQNNRYIDHTIRVDNIFKAEDKYQINERGWVDVQDDHLIEKGDRLAINTWTLYHHKCFRTRQAKRQRAYFRSIFKKAGFENLTMTQIPNQYHGDKCTVCAPWYQVVTNGVLFIVGWRKRVISIECPVPGINMHQLFPDENVTKDKNFIHAWGRKKCIEYLQKIRTNI